ncbi:hypothetical protein PORY_002016 [Pneumocystis oryctolagi]|uniref:Uncharacterized protein n=1 Tax=Pneumocystis oryctolagi TaxID=42067 RepID=A0ACB7CCF4_9ASCO|nr:hypothetical protein PORY_002016 [Pneumocystis oryctolagi]
MSKDLKQIENQIKVLNQLDECFSKLQNTLKTKLNESFIQSHKNLTLENNLSKEIENFKEELKKLQEKKCILDKNISTKYYELYEEIMNERKKIKQDINKLTALKEDDFKNLKIEKEYFDKEIKNKELDALEEFKHKLSKIVENIK